MNKTVIAARRDQYIFMQVKNFLYIKRSVVEISLDIKNKIMSPKVDFYG